jgi:hypothetical protein
MHEPVAAPAATGTYHATEHRAVALTVAAVGFILATSIALAFIFFANNAQASDNVDRATALRALAVPLAIALAAVVGISTLLSYAWWIRGVISNLPALGLGYARVSPEWAVVEALIPGVNLVAIGARLAEVAKKLDIESRTYPLIGFAGMLIILPPVAAFWIVRFTRFFDSGDLLPVLSITGIILFAFQAVAYLLLLWVVWQVEARFRTLTEGPTEQAATASAAG